MNLSDFEIYKGKSFASLCRDIVINQNQKRDQLDILINELRALVKSTNEAVAIIPLIRDYFDVGVKNDEQLVKLAAIIQRILSKGPDGEDGGMSGLTDEERKMLQSEVNSVKNAVDQPIKNDVDDIKK